MYPQYILIRPGSLSLLACIFARFPSSFAPDDYRVNSHPTLLENPAVGGSVWAGLEGCVRQPNAYFVVLSGG